MKQLTIVEALPEYGFVYADDPETHTRYLLDKDTDCDFIPEINDIIKADVNDEGYIIKARKKHKFTFFYSSSHPFSNWYMSSFIHHGHEYNCGEQYMMYKKAMMFKDYDVADMIMQQGHPRKQKFLGREVRGFVRGVWDAKCKPIMVEGLTSKFMQDTYCLTTLLDTDDSIIVEASPTDKVWGIGMSEDDPRATNPKLWLGTNWLGEVLMQVRDGIRQGV